MLERLTVPGAPQPGGPYSTAIRAGDFLYISGQGPTDAATGVMQSDATVQQQTTLVLQHLKTILQASGGGVEDVVKCSVFLLHAEDFAAMNEAYAEFFGAAKPTRTTVATGMVAEGMKVEIDCVAYLPKTV